MFILHTSNRTENLAEQLATVIEAGPPSSLFEREVFLVQSRGMERMLSQFLAEAFGVWCHSAYLLPVHFIDFLCESLSRAGNSAAFSRDVLTWRLERLLRDCTDPALEPIRIYLSGEQSDLKRFQFARRLADCFDQYQIMRPDYIQAWEQGVGVTGDQAEAWQRLLWKRLRDEDASASARGELILSLIEALHDEEVRAQLPFRRLFVFGVHTIPPLFLGVLDALGQSVDVHLFLLSPCREYWGDIESRRAHLRREVKRDDDASGGSKFAPLHHPLLSGLGRQGADFLELLLELVDGWATGAECFSDPRERENPGLLHHLQSDLLVGRDAPVHALAERPAPDDSITVVSCYSRLRELMVLKDYLLSLLYDDPGLGLHEVIVMAPDIQDYAGLIPALFHDITHDISDCRARRTNGYLDAFLHFLQLFSGRYTANDLCGLLERPEIGARFSLSAGDLELIRHWVLDVGIRWGLSAGQRGDDGLLEFDAGSWRNGLERLLLGLTLDAEHPIDDIVPYPEIEGSQGEVLGGLCEFVSVIDQARRISRSAKTLTEWADFLRVFCSYLFVADDHPDQMELQRIIARLDDEFAPYHREPIIFEVVCRWLETEAETSSARGFLSGRLTFCSMLPMRSIPFRVICLLGLNDGAYPKADHFAPFDLSAKTYRRGDRSRRSDDRYQFLEAILAARERLYLSYVGRSIKTNKSIEPSVVITELLETLKSYYGVVGLTVTHPLHPYHAAYFSPEGTLFSYDDYHCRVAVALKADSAADAPPWPAVPVAVEPIRNIAVAELRSFLGGPQAYFLKRTMGIELRTQADLPADHEPFTLDPLAAYCAGQAIVQRLLDGEDLERITAVLQGSLQWPLAGPGRLVLEQAIEPIMNFVDSVQAAGFGKARPPLRVDLLMNGVHLAGLVEHQYECGTLLYRFAYLKGRDLLTAWLYHLCAAAMRCRRTTVVVARDHTIAIEAEAGGADDLAAILRLFQDGRRAPSPLHVEPAFAYARQVASNRGRGKKPPIEKARAVYTEWYENGYTPENELLYQALSAEQVLSDSFVALCEEVMVPLWDLVAKSVCGGEHG